MALALLREAKSPDDLLPTVNVTAALAFVPTRPNDALALCDEALAAKEKAKAVDPAETYGWDALRCRAEALLALGRSAAAVPLLERSITLERRTFRGDDARAQFALARALVSSRGDAKRAIDLATAARGAFAKYPFLSFELHAVDAWIADRKK
jgi:tetratricopeptide (TPR) repeat protein